MDEMTTSDKPIDLWNSEEIGHAVLDEILYRPRSRLDRISDAPRFPGYYLIFLKTPRNRGSSSTSTLYGPLSRGTYPIYAGSAKNLHARIQSHRRRIEPVENLRGGKDLWISWVAMTSHGDAKHAESTLIELLEPLWNRSWASGFGSRYQGRNRTSQAPSPWATLHPGRQDGLGEARVPPGELARHVAGWFASYRLPELWHPINGRQR